jgi:hypothetical protein
MFCKKGMTMLTEQEEIDLYKKIHSFITAA